jgi:HD-GYP domain-containing protein (c-di-GMP phosphodiesterase class II)
VDAALARKAQGDVRFEDALLEVGFSEVQLLRLLAEVYRTQFITTAKLAKINISERTLRLIPRALAERRLVVPLALDTERKLLVVTPDPESLDMVKDILIASQAREVKALVARPLAVLAAISKHYAGDQSAFTVLAPTGFFPDENLHITDSQSSFALFHNQTLEHLEAPSGVRSSNPPPAPEPDSRPRSQPPMRRPPSLSNMRASEPPQLLEPPSETEHPIPPPPTTRISSDVNELASRAPLPPIPRPSNLPRVSSIPAAVEPDELEVVELTSPGEARLIASPLRFAEALVSLHEQGRKNLAQHSLTVARLAANFTHSLGLSDEEQLEAQLSGLIHDLGKSRVHHLTAYNVWLDQSYEGVARKECTRPSLCLKNAGLSLSVISAVNHMYERYDGRGFPSGLEAHEIPLTSRVLALADSYADLTLNPANAFERTLSPAEAVSALRSHPEAVFDPELLETFAAWILEDDAPISALAEGE